MLRRFVALRDDRCRTPWCDAPIRHLDHAEAVATGGLTHVGNAQGLCERCNRAKEAAGWRTSVDADGPDGEVRTTTPTGWTYASAVPPPPVAHPPDDSDLVPPEVRWPDVDWDGDLVLIA